MVAGFLSFLVLFGLTDIIFGNAITERIVSIFELDRGTVGVRIRIWSITWQMIKESPLFGMGVGNWKIEFQENGMAESHMFVAEPLNDHIGVFAESGIFGLIGFTGAQMVGIFLLGRSVWHRGIAENRFSLAVMASLLTFMVVSFFNFPMHRIEHSTLMLFGLAVADAHVQDRPLIVSRGLKMGISLIFLLLSVSAFYLGTERYIGEKNTRLALEARANHEWKQVIRYVDKVNLRLYPIEPSTTPVIWYRGIANFQLGKTDKALEDFLEARRVSPFHIHALNNIATCYAIKGDLDLAIEFYTEAIRINDRFSDALENLIAVHLSRNETGKVLKLIRESPFSNGGPKPVRARLSKIEERLKKSRKVK